MKNKFIKPEINYEPLTQLNIDIKDEFTKGFTQMADALGKAILAVEGFKVASRIQYKLELIHDPILGSSYQLVAYDPGPPELPKKSLWDMAFPKLMEGGIPKGQIIMIGTGMPSSKSNWFKAMWEHNLNQDKGIHLIDLERSQEDFKREMLGSWPKEYPGIKDILIDEEAIRNAPNTFNEMVKSMRRKQGDGDND